MRTKKINVNYKFLQISGGIETVGSVPSLQVYNGEVNEYTPDYTLTALTLFPRCNATDRDKLTASGNINALLTNMTWHEQIDGVKTLITSTNTNYAITDSGTTKGTIVVKKNASVLHPITLIFHAEYVDTRTGQVYQYDYTKVVKAQDATLAMPVVSIDSPSSVMYNPLRDQISQKITAKVLVADQDITNTNKCSIFFYRLLANGSLEAVGTNGDNDWEITAKTKDSITINRDKIGNGVTYVVKCSYDPDGSPSSIPSDASIATTRIERCIPKLECDWKGVSSGVPGGTTTINPIPIIWDNKGTFSNTVAAKDLLPVWYTKAATASSYTIAAKGYSPSIAMTDGMILKLEIEDKGALRYITENGKVVTSSGKAILVRPNI